MAARRAFLFVLGATENSLPQGSYNSHHNAQKSPLSDDLWATLPKNTHPLPRDRKGTEVLVSILCPRRRGPPYELQLVVTVTAKFFPPAFRIYLTCFRKINKLVSSTRISAHRLGSPRSDRSQAGIHFSLSK